MIFWIRLRLFLASLRFPPCHQMTPIPIQHVEVQCERYQTSTITLGVPTITSCVDLTCMHSHRVATTGSEIQYSHSGFRERIRIVLSVCSADSENGINRFYNIGTRP